MPQSTSVPAEGTKSSKAAPGKAPPSEVPGDSSQCPLDYRYAPSDLNRPPQWSAETVYVIGGLYGNPEALDAVLSMAEGERRRGCEVSLVFNGDFNWFNVDPHDYARINGEVLGHIAIAGNVEAELGREGEGGHCGCNYPAYVNPEIPERSDRIFRRLKDTARRFPEIQRGLAGLPKYLTVGVGSHRIGILHGDADSLSGWSLAVEALPPSREETSGALAGEDAASLTPLAEIERIFRDSGMNALAATHTCLPFAQDWTVDGETRLIINNGSAGMPNFRGRPEGVLTRISALPSIPAGSLYGFAWGGVRYDALPIAFDREAWRRRFLRDWAPGSPAHGSYFNRIDQGPAFMLEEAARGQVRLGTP